MPPRSGFPIGAQPAPAPSTLPKFERRSTRQQVTISFGCVDRGEDGFVSTHVDASWVLERSRIVITPAPAGTIDHEPDDAAVEGIIFRIGSIEPGVGFNLFAFAPQGSWGQYLVDVTG